MKYINRVVEPIIREYLHHFPVVGITGPRQSGKSTMLNHLLPDYTYVTFDDLQMRHFFIEDPYGFLEQYHHKIIFDEVQKVPEIFDLIKLSVDKDRQNYGQYVLTGSSQFHLLQHVSESLAGRIGLLSLLPFQYSEMPEELRKVSVYKGSYPELVTRQYHASKSWYSSYIDTYVHKDLRDIRNIGNLRDFQRFLRMLAAQTSQQLNLSTYAKELGVSVPTIKSWVSVLETSYIIFLLPPYFKNYGKRITKSPKVYFYDTGLVSYLTAIETHEQFSKGPMNGALFENYVVAEVMKKNLHSKTDAELFYYRTSAGDEIDLIVDYKTHQDFIEIKYTSTVKTNMVDTIKKLLEKENKGYLLYNGNPFPFSKNLMAMNYQDYLMADASTVDITST